MSPIQIACHFLVEHQITVVKTLYQIVVEKRDMECSENPMKTPVFHISSQPQRFSVDILF